MFSVNFLTNQHILIIIGNQSGDRHPYILISRLFFSNWFSTLVLAYIIARITAGSIGLAAILAITTVSTFITAVILYIYFFFTFSATNRNQKQNHQLVIQQSDQRTTVW